MIKEVNMSAEYPDASFVSVPGFGFPQGAHGRNGQTARWIVLHGTASGDGTAEQQAEFFAGDPANGVHFVIGKDGTVMQLVALADAAYGNGGPTQNELQAHAYADFWNAEIQAGVNLNLVTVSIEHCKIASDNSDVLTPEQQAASFKLVAWLCQTLGIPARPADENGGITGHSSINGINRARCPGPYPWSDLFASLQPKGTSAMSGMLLQHPTDTGRLDVVYLGHDGSVYHAHNASNGMAGLFTGLSASNFGAPTAEPLVSVEATFNSSGESIAVVGVGVSGQVYGRSFNTPDESPQNDWTALDRVFSAFPPPPAPPKPENG